MQEPGGREVWYGHSSITLPEQVAMLHVQTEISGDLAETWVSSRAGV